MSTAFVPKDFPRTKLANGRVLSDAQQHQYDVLRSVGGKLVSNRNGWWRVHSDTHRAKIQGLNTTAMWSLVNFGLVVCVDDGAPIPGYLFLLPDQAKDVPGPRYVRTGSIVKAKPSEPQILNNDPPGTLRIKDVGDRRVITLTGVHEEKP